MCIWRPTLFGAERLLARPVEVYQYFRHVAIYSRARGGPPCAGHRTNASGASPQPIITARRAPPCDPPPAHQALLSMPQRCSATMSRPWCHAPGVGRPAQAAAAVEPHLSNRALPRRRGPGPWPTALYDLTRLESLILKQVRGLLPTPAGGLMRAAFTACSPSCTSPGMAQTLDRVLDGANRAADPPAAVLLALLREEARHRQERKPRLPSAAGAPALDWSLGHLPLRAPADGGRLAHPRPSPVWDHRRAENLVLIGPPGTRQDRTGHRLLRQALVNGYRGRFYNAQDLIDELYASLADHSTTRLLKRLAPTTCWPSTNWGT